MKSYDLEPEAIVELPTTTIMPSSTTEAEDIILNKELLKCLSEHSSKFNYFSPPDQKALLYNNTHGDEKEVQSEIMNSSSVYGLSPGVRMHFFLIEFSQLMESLGIKLQLTEPHVLFCLLPSARKYNVRTRDFDPAKMRGLSNVMTFGVSEEEAKVLDETSSRLKIIVGSGFRIQRYPNRAEFGTRPQPGETLHYLFGKSDMMIHLVVFYQRETYMWHPKFNTSEINLKGMLFTEDGAFDNFTTSPMNLSSSAAEIYLPSDSRCFLLALDSSKFLECNSFNNTSSEVNTTLVVNDKNNEQLRNQVVAALKELKIVFGSQMVNFWLWERTLFGWFEKCDILQYSSTLELSVAMKSVKGYNFTGLFADSACRTVKQDFNLSIDPYIELKCQDIDVKISLMHKEVNGVWYAHNVGGLSSYRQIFPIFKVCSTDVFGLKVNVPCDVNKIFEIEFGKNWKNTSLNFSPESMRNLFNFCDKDCNKYVTPIV